MAASTFVPLSDTVLLQY